MAGNNARNQSIIGNARTVPFIARPLSPYASTPGSWQLSMLLSPANYPDTTSIPSPNPDTVVLELLGAHTFATLLFSATKHAGDPYYDAPYFTYFLACDVQLAAGLPPGWQIKNDSVWSPSWLFYNNQTADAWTSACLAEVEPSGAASPVVVPLFGTTSTLTLPERRMSPLVTPRREGGALVGTTDAPPICGVLLEFETFAWGAWAPPHAPNVVIDQLSGGTYGMSASDAANGIVYMGTLGFSFYAVQIAAINVSSGSLSLFPGLNYLPLPPSGFTGVSAIVLAIDCAAGVGLLVAMTEVSKYGPLPPLPAAPGLPVGWTVISVVDPTTGTSTALTSDLTPALAALPPPVGGLGSYDDTGRIFWLLASSTYLQVDKGSTFGRRALIETSAPGARAPSNTSVSFLVGVHLDTRGKPMAPPTIDVITTAGNGLWVTAYEYSSAALGIVTIEFPQPLNSVGAGVVNLYAANGTVVSLGALPPNQVQPGFGQSAVSADGRYVYFQVQQSEAALFSEGLVTVDVISGTISLALAAPDDEYDVLGLFRCS